MDEARLYQQSKASALALTRKLTSRYRSIENELKFRWRELLDSGPVLPYERRALAEELSRYWELLDPATRMAIERQLGDDLNAVRALAASRLTGTAPDLTGQGIDRIIQGLESIASRARERMVQTAATGIGMKLAFGGASAQLRALMGRANTEAGAVTMTTTYETYHDTRLAMLQEQGIELVQVLTAGDDRVCPACAAREGYVYRLDELELPWHMRCRCIAIPVSEAELDSDSPLVIESTAVRAATLEALSQAGKSPNYGLTPGERYRGLNEPIQPIWTP